MVDLGDKNREALSRTPQRVTMSSLRSSVIRWLHNEILLHDISTMHVWHGPQLPLHCISNNIVCHLSGRWRSRRQWWAVDAHGSCAYLQHHHGLLFANEARGEGGRTPRWQVYEDHIKASDHAIKIRAHLWIRFFCCDWNLLNSKIYHIQNL